MPGLTIKTGLTKNPFKEDEVVPYRDLSEVAWFVETVKSNKLPQWLNQVKKLNKSTYFCFEGTNPDSLTPGKQFLRRSVPKTLLCHDFKGGYQNDRFVNFNDAGAACPSDNSYYFYHWWSVDLFVYFSHNFVTVPPPCWINAAHSHGVPILGTLITEWDSGSELWEKIFETDENFNWFVDALVSIADKHQFDGYLLNIENSLNEDHAVKMIKFTKLLKKKLPGDSYLIWYDSVTSRGHLKWQNELNNLNIEFFKGCDGIFLNYNWTEDNLKKSLQMAEMRAFEVYVGVDVFGRGCLGGGGFGSIEAVKLIRKLNMSVALFAFGWTFETCCGDEKLVHDRLFWSGLSPYLYLHGLEFDMYEMIELKTFCPGICGNNNSQKNLLPIMMSFNDHFKTDEARKMFHHLNNLNETDRLEEWAVFKEFIYKEVPSPPVEPSELRGKCVLKVNPNKGLSRYIRLFILDTATCRNLKVVTILSTKATFKIVLVVETARSKFEKLVCHKSSNESKYGDPELKLMEKEYTFNVLGTMVEVGLLLQTSTTESFLHSLKISRAPS